MHMCGDDSIIMLCYLHVLLCFLLVCCSCMCLGMLYCTGVFRNVVVFVVVFVLVCLGMLYSF